MIVKTEMVINGIFADMAEFFHLRDLMFEVQKIFEVQIMFLFHRKLLIP